MRELLRKLNVEFVPRHTAELKTTPCKMTKCFLEPEAASRHLDKTRAVRTVWIMKCVCSITGNFIAPMAATALDFCFLKF